MPKVEIKKEWMRRARERAVLEPDERKRIAEFLAPQTSVYTFDIELSDWPTPLWRALLDEAKLTPNVRSVIALHAFGIHHSDVHLDSIYEATVESPVEFGTTLQLSGSGSPNCEMYLNGRWYPVIVKVHFVEDDQKWARGVQLLCSLRLGERTFGVQHYISRDLFLDESAQPQLRTVAEILGRFGYRRLQTSVSDFNLRLVKAERAAADNGQVVMVTGSVIAPSKFSWWRGFETQSLGTPDMPARCVIESALESRDVEYLHGGYSLQNNQPPRCAR